MHDDKVKLYWKNRVNRKILILIAFVILAGIGIAAVKNTANIYQRDLFP